MAVSLGPTILPTPGSHRVTGPDRSSTLGDPAPGLGSVAPTARSTASITVSVVIPAKNEAANIAWVLRGLPSLVDEVILVDGHSTDQTVAVAKAIRPDIVVFTEERPGKGSAIRQGLAAATGDLVIMLDSDCSMEPAEIPLMVDALAAGCDMVKGSRFMPGGGSEDISPIRDLGNAVLVRMTNFLFETKHTDLCYGYMGFRRARLESLTLEADGFEIETEIVLQAIKAGFAIAEIPSYESARRFGSSHLNAFRDGMRVLRTILRQRFGSTGSTIEWPTVASPSDRVDAFLAGVSVGDDEASAES